MAIGEASDDSLLQKTGKERFQSIVVDVNGLLLLVEGVVECENMVLDVFGDAIDFVLGFVDLDLWVGA